MVTQICNLCLAAVVLAGCSKAGDGGQALPPATGPGSPPLPTLPAAATASAPAPSAAVASTRRATGTLLPHAEVAVVARSHGAVVALSVEVGDHVKQGQILFRVDARDAELRLAQAQTQLAAAQQQLAATEVEHRRVQGLFDQQAASPQQRDQITAQRDAARVGVDQARNGVAMASKAVADATVRAPIDGIVVTRRVSLGDTVSDSPAPLLVVQDQARLDLKFRLPDRALATVQAGDAITVALPALATARKAAISIVAPSVDPRNRTVELTAVLDNRDGALRPGLMAEVELAAKVAGAR